MDALPDGEYSIFIIDVEEVGEETVKLEITITSGDHKGDVLTVRASHLRGDALQLIGLPGELVVRDGVPRVAIER